MSAPLAIASGVEMTIKLGDYGCARGASEIDQLNR
jgi:hypothetical protein